MNPDAKEQFKQRVRRWQERLDVGQLSVVVRPMTRKWASFSTSGRVTFDEYLLELDSKLQDYVIVHELLHERVPNHGKLWKSLMRAHLGGYERQEIELRRIAATTERARWPSKTNRAGATT